MKVRSSIEELIGKTPMVELCKTERAFRLKARLFAKLEYFNPAGSVKDRVARALIDGAEKRGALVKGSVVIEPTSGNTGIGLAMVCAARGYRLIIVMPDSMSAERRALLRAYGAEVELSPGARGMSGAIEFAREIADRTPGAFIPGQFTSPDNAAAHFSATGPEIYSDLDGKVDVFVAGVGTGGTLTGVGRYLKSKNGDIKAVAVEPASSPVLGGGKAGAHGIQGIGAGFVPEILDVDVIDEVIGVSDSDAFSAAREIAKREGILVGISSGAALCAAVKVAKRAENAEKNIVVLLPDGGDRYLSTALFGTKQSK